MGRTAFVLLVGGTDIVVVVLPASRADRLLYHAGPAVPTEHHARKESDYRFIRASPGIQRKHPLHRIKVVFGNNRLVVAFNDRPFAFVFLHPLINFVAGCCVLALGQRTDVERIFQQPDHRRRRPGRSHIRL